MKLVLLRSSKGHLLHALLEIAHPHSHLFQSLCTAKISTFIIVYRAATQSHHTAISNHEITRRSMSPFDEANIPVCDPHWLKAVALMNQRTRGMSKHHGKHVMSTTAYAPKKTAMTGQ